MIKKINKSLTRGDLPLFLHQYTLLEKRKSKHNSRAVFMYSTTNSNQLNGQRRSTWQESLIPQFLQKVSTRVSRLKHILTLKSIIHFEWSVLILLDFSPPAFTLFPLGIVTLQLKCKIPTVQKDCSSSCHSCFLLWDTEHTEPLNVVLA